MDTRLLRIGLSFAISILTDLAHGLPVSSERIAQTLKACCATIQNFEAVDAATILLALPEVVGSSWNTGNLARRCGRVSHGRN